MPKRSRSGVVSSPCRVEFGQIDPHAARRRSFADHDVERAVLHRGIEDFLDCGRQAVDLVDEEDVAILQIGEQRGKVARLGDDRAAGRPETDAQLLRNDLCQRRLAQPRRAEEEHMIERIGARLCRLDEDAQILARRRLTHELGERLRPQRGVGILGGADRRRQGGLSHNALLPRR